MVAARLFGLLTASPSQGHFHMTLQIVLPPEAQHLAKDVLSSPRFVPSSPKLLPAH